LEALKTELAAKHLPTSSALTDDDTAINKAPTAVISALNLEAPRLPQRSIAILALMLPIKPPTVYMAVTTENVVSDMGMHTGKP